MTSEPMSPVAADDPLMVAWTAYKATPEYANTRRWAVQEAHTEGSLWAAFVEGFRRSPAGGRAQGERQPPDVGVGKLASQLGDMILGARRIPLTRQQYIDGTSYGVTLEGTIDCVTLARSILSALSAPVSEPSDADLDPSAPKAGPALKAFVAKGRRLLEPSDAVRGEAGELLEKLKEATAERDALQKALTGLTCNGSEFFLRRPDGSYKADIEACVGWVRRTKEAAHRRTVDAILARQAAEAERAALRQELSDLRAGRGGERERLDRAEKALRGLVDLEKSITADVGSAHSNRGNGASEWMREDDREMRGDLRKAFDAARSYFASLSPVDGGDEPSPANPDAGRA